MICVDSTLYMLVTPDRVPGKSYRNHYEFIEVWTSTDHSATWQKPTWKFLQSENLTIRLEWEFGASALGRCVRPH